MVSAAAAVLKDQAAALVVLLRQWQSETNTPASKLSAQNSIESIQAQIRFVSDTAKLSTSDCSKLDLAGTELWNACRARYEGGSLNDINIVTMVSRVFSVAVGLLDLASPFDAPGHIRILGVSCEAAIVCIASADLDSALSVLKVAAKRLDSLEKHDPPVDEVQLHSITAEYWMLRAHCAWAEGRPDIADHLCTKAPLNDDIRNRSTVVMICLCIGREALEIGEFDTSVKWLEIALERLAQNPDDDKVDLDELQLHTRHTLAWAYLIIGTSEAAKKLKGQMEVLKTRYGEMAAVQFLQLEVIRRQARVDTSELAVCRIWEYLKIGELLKSSQDGLYLKADYFFSLHQLCTKMGEEEFVCRERDQNLAFVVLTSVEQVLGDEKVILCVHKLESICSDSYNLNWHILNLISPERARDALEITKEILNLSKQRHESILAEKARSQVNGEENEEVGEATSKLSYIAYELLHLEVGILSCCNQSQTNSKIKLENYVRIYKAIKSIRDQAPRYIEQHPLDADTLRRLSANEFEAAVALQDWDAMTTIIRHSESHFDAILCDHFTHCILAFEIPDAYKAVSIRTISEISSRIGGATPTSRGGHPFYLHHLFKLALGVAKSESSAKTTGLHEEWPDAYYKMAESVIDEILLQADGKEPSVDDEHRKPSLNSDVSSGESLPTGSDPFVWPTNELGYLATCSFNQAMDFYSAENDERCLRWAHKAVQLAEMMHTPRGDELAHLFKIRLDGLF